MWLKLNLILLLLFCYAVAPVSVSATEEIVVAVASNFIAPMEEIAARFEALTGIKVQKSYSSTGTLYAQITNGAPFDLFLAADPRRPRLLHELDLCDVPVTYARGQTVLWTSRSNLDTEMSWQDILVSQEVNKVAIPKPLIAPYGEAAANVMEKLGVWKRVQKKMVYTQNVAQAFQYGRQGAVDLAFTALSYALSDKALAGSYWILPEAESVIQNGCVVTRSDNPKAAKKLLAYLTSPDIWPLLKTFGYN